MQHKPNSTPGYAQGGSVMGARMLPSGEGSSELSQQYPEVSGFLQSMLGTAPDELGGSVLDPNYQRMRAGAEYGFPAGAALDLAPGLGPLSKLAGRGVRAGARNLAVPSQLSKQAGVIKAPGGQWLSGSVEGSLSPLKQPVRDYAPGAYGYDTPAQNPLNIRAQALNKFVEGPLTKYVKNQMATPTDPVRAMAERGVLHQAVPEGGDWVPEYLESSRRKAGYPAEGLGRSDLAKHWELAADTVIKSKPASYYQQGLSEVDPWLLKADPTTQVYQSEQDLSELGFKHLTDELRNALNPESGLPRNLMLTPEQMQGYGVEKAVQRVSDINAWRAAQEVEANQGLAFNPAAVMHKEYPGEANPRGLHWRELKQPADLPEGWAETSRASGSKGWTDPEGQLRDKSPTYSSLEDQLKYEGDQMGHCVGGYCPDVVEGKSKIYSLRDSKGQPHVTIEVAPKRNYGRMEEGNELGEDYLDSLYGAASKDPEINKLIEYGDSDTPEIIARLQSHHPEVYNKHFNIEEPPSIVQIKGKGNKAPVAEYLPMVQDFVRSGKWSNVGDLSNAGLIDARAAGKPLPGRPSFMTNEEFKAFQNETGNPETGFAQGGIVDNSISGYNPAHVDELVNQLRTELFQ